jgi:hypothetical protein
VVYPESREEVVEVIRFAYGNRILEIRPDDSIGRVEPGALRTGSSTRRSWTTGCFSRSTLAGTLP